jgi:VanZ family protein
MSELLRPRAIIAQWIWWAGFLVVGMACGALSLLGYMEGLPVGITKGGVDKVVHFLAGGLLAFFLDGALRRRMLFKGESYSVPVAVVVLLIPAAIEEWAQRFSSNRSSSIWDFAADVAGVIVLTALSRRIAE